MGRYTLPAAAIVSIASPAYSCSTFQSEKPKTGVPIGSNFSECRRPGLEAESGGRTVGFSFRRVVGKHLLIDYAVALTPGGAVHSVEILQYRNPTAARSEAPAGWPSS